MIGKFVKWSKRKYTKKQKIIGFVMAGLAFLVVIPFILASASPFIDTKLNLSKLIPEPFNFIIASFFIVFGLLFSVWSGFAQFRIGRGTPVPVIPTQKLVTTGPYALCRNPMLLGSVIYYSGISLWLNSLSAVIITALFLLCSTLYIKLVEEKELEARFGMEYEEYRRKTPFLIPRLRKVKQHSSRVFETKKLIKMNAEEKIYEKGLEKYPVSFIIGQNIFLFIYFGIGFIGMLPLRIHGFPIISVLYAIFLITMLLFVLRKHLCTNCYYYGKLCNTGWGKISALMFSKNSGNYQLGIKLANITWIVATMLPIAGIIGVLILNYSIINLILFTLFILLTPVNFVIHKKACEKCKMRLFCPASMAKGG